ncbi:DUF3919 family protein [Clostridium tagluense]|uniref:DUF3919 family protein n=1 Tax=Clostridium tagluense TaxID=360422 RepID=UPI001CF18C86|nr:DUF3919 family protein [Clostridium tagluense]MCB2312620.1 DUF3919 family protein [Clostridium tagluense]MCB2317296.1 DUF3919 family protein [Clostridium tagluense]MCB2322163.1 DUF3919 family protein [Clostridium tagluense]MCB2327092.1 DUF3919 family protein [Clostridium tagluense]MCB2331810.1 DUF3919 family protein [Clostridium tagluense]
MLSLGIIIFWQYKKNYDHLVLIQDREQVLEAARTSTPVKLEVYSNRWGKAVISDSKTIENIWNVIDAMSKSSPLQESQNTYTSDEISGTIYYLNGKKSTFSLGTYLKISAIIYGNPKDKPYVDKLKNYVYEILCRPENLSNLINERNKVTVVDSDNNIQKCGSDDKTSIRNKILKCSKIQDNEALEEAINTKGKVLYHIKTYMEKESSSIINTKETSYAIINIDVYKNGYIVIQDFSNEVVNAIYMKGNLLEVCKNISKTGI